MEDDKTRACLMGKEAALLDFSSALQGLLAGHSEALQKLRSDLGVKDRAFLMALALTEKGRRLDSDGIMVTAIRAGIDSTCSTEIERDFLKNG